MDGVGLGRLIILPGSSYLGRDAADGSSEGGGRLPASNGGGYHGGQ